MRAAVIIEAYSRFSQQLKEPPKLIPGHVCTCKCVMFQHERIFICQQTGNMHICTIGECDAIVVTDEYTMCSKTSTEYPFMSVGHTQSDLIDFQNRVSLVPKSERKRVTKPAQTAQVEQIGPMRDKVRDVADLFLFDSLDHLSSFVARTKRPRSASMKSSSSEPQRRKPKHGPEIMTRRWQRPKRQRLSRDQVDQGFYDRLTTVCLETWKKIKTTPTYQGSSEPKKGESKNGKKRSYEFKHHVMVIMYESKEGFESPGISIPYDPICEKGLLPVQEMRKYDIANMYKTCTGIFRTCAEDLRQKASRAHATREPASQSHVMMEDVEMI